MDVSEIDRLEAGPELDALVAERVMGLDPWPDVPGAFRALIVPIGQTPKPCLPPEYSTDIRAAWTVVERLETLHLKHAGEHGDWEAIFCGHPESLSHGETAPLAVCRAALKAVASAR